MLWKAIVSPFPPRWLSGLLVATAALAGSAGCSKASRAATSSAAPDEMNAGQSPSPSQGGAKGDCSHAVCGNDFFIDVASPASCPVGAPCSVTLKLVATGDFHINEDYPYKFRADDAKGVEYLGTDEGGKNVFSKGANDWAKKDEKTGAMDVAFRGNEKGDKPISGTFKLSVCSAQACQLEQQAVSTTVAIR
jgi:hypothetical protein